MSGTTFEYRAAGADGQTVTGQTTAETKVEAFRQVSAMGLTPLSLRRREGRAGARGGRRISKKDVAHLTYQLSVFIESSIPIGEGLVSIAEQESNPRMRGVLMDIATRIEAGERIADALDAHRELFGDIFIENIRAAERSGTLSKVLKHLSEMLERREEAANQLRSALMYPAVVVTVLTGATLFLLTVVLPKFAKMFEDRGVELPLFSRVVMGFGSLMGSYWYIGLAVVVASVFAFRRAWRTPRGRLAIDKFFHRLPLVGRLLVGVSVSRLMRVFGVGLGAGLGLIECLELAGRAAGRPMLYRETSLMVERLAAGARLHEAMLLSGYLPPFAKRMLRAGEEAGELTKMSEVVARHYERESIYVLKNVVTVIEPVLVVAIACVVLVVALSIFLPMWNMVVLVE